MASGPFAARAFLVVQQEYNCVTVASMEIEVDDGNRPHLLGHGIDLQLLTILVVNRPILYDYSQAYRSGDFRMIAPDNDGRFWTIALRQVGVDRFRPITGWPSTNRQIRYYRETLEEK